MFAQDKTHKEYMRAVGQCKDIFKKKMHDYGTAWRVLRNGSIADQIYIKACRVRSIDNKGTKKVDEEVSAEFTGIVNYAIMGLIQLEVGELKPSKKLSANSGLAEKEAYRHYDNHVRRAMELMENKNHDYDEAWRDMKVSSFTDLILMKLIRIRKIEEHGGKTLISEGVEANYYDIINYGIFALIKLQK